MSVKEKEAAAIADIYFSSAINERTAMRSRAVERDSEREGRREKGGGGGGFVSEG